jgi:hypothetical protein
MYWLLLLLSAYLHQASLPQAPVSRVSSLLADIAALQQRDNGFFSAGAFPSTRIHASRPHIVRRDNNIFFTGLIGLGLRRLRPDLGQADRVVCDAILARMQPAIPLYRNRQGRPTYNFWKTNPPQIFPEDPWLELGDRSHALPDDLDDTVILLEALGGEGDSSARVVKALMEAHANGVGRVLHTSYRRYRRKGVYSTWFGRRMPIDLDFSVLCNVLYWVRANQLPFGAADSATVDVLRDMTRRGLPVTDPAYASPHYARTPVVLYHIGRLLGTFSIPALDSLKPLLVAQTRAAFRDARDPMDQVLLASTLLRLGVSAADIPPIHMGSLEEEDDRFFFFIASFSDYMRNPFRRIFLHAGLLRYEFRCTAYNRFLLLEYLVLRETSWKRSHAGM